MIYFQPTLLKSAIEFFFVVFIAALLALSLFCICFILLIRFKSRSSRHLQNFNSLWTVRFLFIVFIAFWGLTEVIRLPLFQRVYLRPIFPKLTPPQQANFCKLHLVLSLGIFEPGFLVILLFLLDVSVKKATPKGFFSVFYVSASCLPLFLLQVYFVFLGGSKVHFPNFFNRSWFLFQKDMDEVLPSSFESLPSRSQSSCLPLQIMLRVVSFLDTGQTTHDVFDISVFLTTFTCAVVGEGILVIKPISDSLNAIREQVEQPLTLGKSSSPPPAEDGVGASINV
ncbi:Detected protein of unknown function [Hibiscus syriacus]|uniref:Uncharacterized protein n=1 Tax=Hibiscus syriacus TaxID=106335 RepID=A0A6A2ZUX6_HIBSY|nr:Detected protein of unknown function [Hibiscus syriacus]